MSRNIEFLNRLTNGQFCEHGTIIDLLDISMRFFFIKKWRYGGWILAPSSGMKAYGGVDVQIHVFLT
jgi:hypothetical protein